jgi:hypothetical protein
MRRYSVITLILLALTGCAGKQAHLVIPKGTPAEFTEDCPLDERGQQLRPCKVKAKVQGTVDVRKGK